MMVYVISRIVRMAPFTIQLLYENTEYHQECTLGIDAGSTGGRPVLRDIDWNLVTKTASVNAKTVKFLSRKKGSILYQLVKKH